MQPRRHLSGKERQRLFELHGGCCHICGTPIDEVHDGYEIDHVIPLEISRDESDANMQPAHKKCHKRKTREADRPAIDKALRLFAKHHDHRARPRGNRLRGRPFQPSRRFA